MILTKICIGLGNYGRDRGPDAVRSRLKLRPAVTALEGRTLLSSFTLHGKPDVAHTPAPEVSMSRQTHSGTTANEHGGGAENSGGNRALARIVPSVDSARAGGELLGSHQPNDTRRAHARPRRGSTGPIFSDSFNGSGGVPKNWSEFGSGTVTEGSGAVTLAASNTSNGLSVGIGSTLAGAVFSPQGKSIQAQIKSVSASPVGNAIVGILGVPNQNGPTGELAAGIDATGVVFVVVQQQNPAISQSIVPVGTVKNYKGGPIALGFSIDSTGVRVSAGSTKFAETPFSDFKGFSLSSAFGGGAIPALVGAGQPTGKGGSASFRSITVTTGTLKRR
jgi:hypothetical protein